MPMQINMREVIARIKSGADGDSFSLDFIQSSGKNKGLPAQRTFRYGAPAQPVHKPARQESPETVNHRDHVDRGTLPLTDLATGSYKTVLISHIVGYNQYKVVH